jgi:integrase
MKRHYRLFKRSTGIFFIQHNATGRQESLRTRDKEAARRIFHARNEAHEQPAINLQIARAYLMACDPLIVKRTWQHVMDELVKTKHGSTLERWQRAIKDKALDSIRSLPLVETQAEQLFRVLEKGTVSTNVHLRKLHNFCLAMNWLPWPTIPKKQWPPVQFKEKRAITLKEHCRIVERENNPERKKFYELCWHLGGSQGDIANLKAEDVDWENRTVSFTRKKTGVPVILHLGEEALNTLKDLPSEGLLFPYLSGVRAGDRATEFKQRCRGLGIEGVSLHSYRYAWAERAKTCGYPERFAQEALGHNSIAVHRAYAKKAKVKLPSLEEYERKIVPFPNLNHREILKGTPIKEVI